MTEKTTRLILLTGVPGVGKTTLIEKVCGVLREKNIAHEGFITKEVRGREGRIGFDVVLLNGQRCPLARIQNSSTRKPSVGKYGVEVNAFESAVLPLMVSKEKNSVLVLDEIGKMELLSFKFKEAVTKSVEDPEKVILGTVPLKSGGIPLVETVKNRPETLLFTVDKNNRDFLADKIVSCVVDATTKFSSVTA